MLQCVNIYSARKKVSADCTIIVVFVLLYGLALFKSAQWIR